MTNQIQESFFKKIDSILPSHESLAQNLSDILDISVDSAYRRIRLETALSINEVYTLCNHFHISFDSFLMSSPGQVTFNYAQLGEEITSLDGYLDNIIRDLTMINEIPGAHIIYASQDIPIFQNIHFDGIAAFKMFYWLRSILGVDELISRKFSMEAIPDRLLEKGKKIFDLYAQIKSTEIWTNTTVQSTLKQITFYWESGLFASEKDAIKVCRSMQEQVEHVQQQAELGSKMVNNPDYSSYADNYNLYISEIEITNNAVMVDLVNTKAVYLGHLTFNTMTTTNADYCKITEHWFNNLVSRSTLVSKVGEKHRYQFFRRLHRDIDRLIDRIEND